MSSDLPEIVPEQHAIPKFKKKPSLITFFTGWWGKKDVATSEETGDLPEVVPEAKKPSPTARLAKWWGKKDNRVSKFINFVFALSFLIPASYSLKWMTDTRVVIGWVIAQVLYTLFSRLVVTGELRIVRSNTERITNTLDYILNAIVEGESLKQHGIGNDIAEAIKAEVRVLLTNVESIDRLWVGIFEPSADEQVLHMIGRAGSTGAGHPRRIPRNPKRASWLAYIKCEPVVLADTTGNDAYDKKENIKSTIALAVTVSDRPRPVAVAVVGADSPNVFTKELGSSLIVPHLQAYLRMIALMVLAEEEGGTNG